MTNKSLRERLFYRVKLLLITISLAYISLYAASKFPGKPTETVSEKDLVEVKVTSYERSTLEQARIMLNDLKHGKDLRAIYKNNKIVEDIEKVYQERDAVHKIEKIIIKYQEKGFFISRHLCGQAIDISKRGKNIEKLFSFLNKVGKVTIIDEGDHFHIQTIAGCPVIKR
jgi:hypothetical protein